MSLLKIKFLVIGIVVSGSMAMFFVMFGRPPEPLHREKVAPPPTSEILDIDHAPTIPLFMGDRAFRAFVANTPSERTRGLSDTPFLPADSALVFVFETSGFWSIWMKDMGYPIDILWLNEHKEIVHIEENVSPDSFPQTFRPLAPARYVIEVNAGVVDALDMKLSEVVVFELY